MRYSSKKVSQVYQLPTTIFLPLLTDRQIPVNRVSAAVVHHDSKCKYRDEELISIVIVEVFRE
jgi:hypothetical protein